MGNVSRWKDWEKTVAEALGGKRRHRTMGSFATVATDVRFPKRMKHRYPILRKVSVECKKRRKLDIVALFAEAVTKYGQKDERVILATKRPVGRFGKAAKKLKVRIEKRYRVGSTLYKQRLKKQLKERYGDKKLGELGKFDKKGFLKHLARVMKLDCGRQVKWETQLLRAKMCNAGLVTVTLEYFAELFKAWLETTV
jgi:hypothetical protein